METFVPPPHSLRVPTQKRGGCRSASPKCRVPKLTKERVTTYTLDKFDSDLHMGLDSDGEAEDSDSHEDRSSARGSESMLRSTCSYAATTLAERLNHQSDILAKDSLLSAIAGGSLMEGDFPFEPTRFKLSGKRVCTSP